MNLPKLPPAYSQSGIAGLALVLALTAAVGLGVYLVQQRTNILPFAAGPTGVSTGTGAGLPAASSGNTPCEVAGKGKGCENETKDPLDDPNLNPPSKIRADAQKKFPDLVKDGKTFCDDSSLPQKGGGTSTFTQERCYKDLIRSDSLAEALCHSVESKGEKPETNKEKRKSCKDNAAVTAIGGTTTVNACKDYVSRLKVADADKSKVANLTGDILYKFSFRGSTKDFLKVEVAQKCPDGQNCQANPKGEGGICAPIKPGGAPSGTDGGTANSTPKAKDGAKRVTDGIAYNPGGKCGTGADKNFYLVGEGTLASQKSKGVDCGSKSLVCAVGGDSQAGCFNSSDVTTTSGDAGANAANNNEAAKNIAQQLGLATELVAAVLNQSACKGNENSVACGNAIGKKVYDEYKARGVDGTEAGKQAIGYMISYLGIKNGTNQAKFDAATGLASTFNIKDCDLRQYIVFAFSKNTELVNKAFGICPAGQEAGGTTTPRDGTQPNL